MSRIVNAIAVDHVRVDEAAELEQMMPITTVAREPRRFQAEYSSDATFTDASNEITDLADP